MDYLRLKIRITKKLSYFSIFVTFFCTHAYAYELELIGKGFESPTDLQFLPTNPDILLITEKTGRLKSYSLDKKTSHIILKLDVLSYSELGLLGLTFHPRFKENKKIYINYNPEKSSKKITRISEFAISPSTPFKAENERVLLEVEQPYSNHNAGQLLFGKDGYLYIGLGDGGSAGDPQGHAQNPKSLLGKMLRIDVDRWTSNTAYSIPSDNPFVKSQNTLPEIWALGLRNPWRYSFDPKNRLIVADVGQYEWEEISIVEAGKNYGWNFKEGDHCYKPKTNCEKPELVNPILEYGRSEGGSITGGYVYLGNKIRELSNHYVYGDYISGKIWAVKLPESNQKVSPSAVKSVGRWPIQISTFGRDQTGEIYVADFSSGKIFKLIK